MYNVGLISLGCEKNRVDAEILLSKIDSCERYNVVYEFSAADIIIVNTCGFIEDAKRESIEEILKVVSLKKDKKSRLKYVISTGCLAQRYKEELLKEIPELDGVIGIGCNSDIVSLLDEVTKDDKVCKFEDKLNMPLYGNRILTTPSHYAYLKIADGCDNRCTYCAIPLIRGRFRSRSIENILEEAHRLSEEGVRELLVIAQDVTRYGEDIYGKPSLPRLLKELCKVDGIEWIRLLYCYPDRIDDELIDLIAKEDKILKYIDVPLQHCNERILKSMNRRGSFDLLSELISKLRTKIPNVKIRTTFICGFPGETDLEFEELVRFVNDCKFERMGCFMYSNEEDTPAFNMKDQIDEDIKSSRCDILMREQERIIENYNRSQIGNVIKVIVDGFDEELNMWIGRSEADSPDVDGRVYFNFEGNIDVCAGKFVYVKILSYDQCDLVGEVCRVCK